MEEENSQQQEKQQKRYDWLKGYQFQPGQSGNPGGKKKGTKSLKTFAKEYLENLPDNEKVAFLAALPEELVFRMAEGNPHSSSDVKVELPPIPIDDLRKDHSIPEDKSAL
jgi:hypothetical protein